MTGGPRWSSRPLRDRPIAAEQSVFRPLCRFPHPVAHRGISCRSTTMNAKHAGLSRRCGRFRNSGFHALARHVASMRRVRSSARPRPSAAAVSFGAMPLPGMSATQAAGIGRTQSILLAAAAVCAGRRSRPHWRTAVASSHRAGRCAPRRAVDPHAWLRDVIAQISDHPQTRLHELLPWEWKARQQRPEAVAQAA